MLSMQRLISVLLFFLMLSSAFAEEMSVRLADDSVWQCRSHKTVFLSLYCEHEGELLYVNHLGAVRAGREAQRLAHVQVAAVSDKQGNRAEQLIGIDLKVPPKDDSDWPGKQSVYLAVTGELFPDRMAEAYPFLPRPPAPSAELKSFRDKLSPFLARETLAVLEDHARPELELRTAEETLRCQRLPAGAGSAEKFQSIFFGDLDHSFGCGMLDCGAGKRLFHSGFPGAPFELASFDHTGTWVFHEVRHVRTPSGAVLFQAAPLSIGMGPANGNSHQSPFTHLLRSTVPIEFRDERNGLFLRQRFNPGVGEYLKTLAQRCESTSARPVLDSLRSYEKRLQEAELVHVVSMLGQMLSGNYLAPDFPLADVCQHDGVVYSREAFVHSQALRSTEPRQVLTVAEAQQLFSLAREMDDIAWNFKMDGCYARAHLMARRFEDLGVHVDKAWLKGDLIVEDGEETIRWNFHVTPVVYVREASGEVRPWAVDPSIMPAAAPLTDWTARMTKHLPGAVTQTAYPFPENAAAYKRAALAITNSHPYLPSDSVFMSEAQKMEQAAQTMREYKGYAP